MGIAKAPKKQSNNFLYLIIVGLLVAAIMMVNSSKSVESTEISIKELSANIRSGTVEELVVNGNKIEISMLDKTKHFTYKEENTNLYSLLDQAGVEQKTLEQLDIKVNNTESQDMIINLLIGLVPFLLIIGFFLFMMRSAQSGNNQAMSFGKSKAKLYDKDKQKTTFNEVAGCNEAKEELEEVVDFLKRPKKYTEMGAKIPKGVMLVGSPGTGKTLLARAVAGEANVPFFNISGSEFVEMFVGVGASRVRDLFTKAKRNAPCIIFIDEIDAVGRHRGAGMGGGHDEREQTLNQILTEMDGFETGTNVIVIAATNRPDILDPALMRPGRFDRKITVDLPDIKAREEILKVHGRNKPLVKDVELDKIAKATPGLSGADLENILNEAAILATKNKKKTITTHDIEQSIEKIMMGPEKKSRVVSEEDKEKTAYHEVGHAIIGHLLAGCDPIRKISIIPRGFAGGVTWSLPQKDRAGISKSQFEDKISMALGGYVAEEIFFGETSTGPSSDLQKVTSMAKSMVTKYGMSKLGPMVFGDQNDEIFLGKSFGHVKNYSEDSAMEIDKMVREIILKAYKQSKDLITKHKKLVIKISEDLIKKENMNDKEFSEYFKNIEVPEKK